MILESEIELRLKKHHWITNCLGLLLVLTFLLPSGISLAQEVETDGPFYIVQEGDSLWDIALRFRVSMAELAEANGINDPSQLKIGDRLLIPGLEGVSGVLTTRNLNYGDNLQSLSRRFQVPTDILLRLNHLASPDELYAGATLVIPETGENAGQTRRATLMPGQSLLELAIMQNTSPWSYVEANKLAGTWRASPGEVLHLQDGSADTRAVNQPGALPEMIKGIQINTDSLFQGKAAVIRITTDSALTLSGSLIEHTLHFFQDETGDLISLQGVHAMVDAGLYTLTLTGVLPDEAPYFGAPFSYSQPVLIRAAGYPLDPVLIVPPETIDPAVTKPEDAQWTALAAPFTPTKLWRGAFQSPAPEPFSECWPSLFGNRRSYNGSAYIYFHTGLDFCGGVGIEILAPAAGKVVFAGPLTVRGNATMIDHGWGVYTGYMHQSEILVRVGDLVEPGQLIGLVGGTGRVTGPHLHWEVWAGGVQVDPLDWLERTYP